MRLEIPEWGTAGGLVLEPETVQALARSQMFDIQPDPLATSRWRLRAKRFVGIAVFRDLEVHVRPKLSVHRVLELLAHSADRIDWFDDDAQWAESDDLLLAIAGAFIEHAERALRPGLLQGYRTIDEDLHAVRGRVDFGRMAGRPRELPLPVSVSYDDFTTDVRENQLLAGAGALILRFADLPVGVRSRLRRLEFRLVDVTPTRPSVDPPDVPWTRLNERYRPAIDLARLILRGAALDFNGRAAHRGVSLLVDMDKVFEDVVGHGIRDALTRIGLDTCLQTSTHLDESKTITIRPDLLIRSGTTPVAVADVKYKQVDSSGPSNPDVYQALAYATRFGLHECTLIYPQRPPGAELRVGGSVVRFASVDLSASPADRTKVLHDIARTLVRARTVSQTLSA